MTQRCRTLRSSSERVSGGNSEEFTSEIQAYVRTIYLGEHCREPASSIFRGFEYQVIRHMGYRATAVIQRSRRETSIPLGKWGKIFHRSVFYLLGVLLDGAAVFGKPRESRISGSVREQDERKYNSRTIVEM